MFKNKKGFVAEVLADIYVFIIFLLIMLIFSILFYFGGETVKTSIKGEYDNLDGNTILLNYLRTPVEVDDKETNIADLILISVDSEEHKGELKTLTQDLLNRLNILSYEDDYAIKIIFPNTEMSIGEVDKVKNNVEKEVGRIMLPSMNDDVYVTIHNFKQDINVIDYATEAVKGDRIRTIDGIIYVNWGKEGLEYHWSTKGGAWSQDGWPCQVEVKDAKVYCKNGYKPTKQDDNACFISHEMFIDLNKRPPSIPKECFKKDSKGKITSKSYYEEPLTDKKTDENCIVTDSSSFPKAVRKTKIGGCVIEPNKDKTKWINWGFKLGDTSMGDPDNRWWSDKKICRGKTIIQKSFKVCEETPKYPPMNGKSGTKDFVQQKELVKKY